MGSSDARENPLATLTAQLHDEVRCGLWGVPLWVCGAYVDARARGSTGRALVQAAGRAHFGDAAFYEGDATWQDEERRTRSRTFCVERWVAACDRVHLAIPRAAAA